MRLPQTVLQSANLTSRLSWQASQSPLSPAVIVGSRTIDFRTLDVLIWRLAAKLQGAGVCRGQVIGLGFSGQFSLLVAMLAVARIGATAYSPDTPELPQPLRPGGEAAMSLLLTDRPGISLPSIPVLPISLKGLLEAGTTPDFSVLDEHPQSPWLIISSSGSTGKPKLVAVDHHTCLARMPLYSDRIRPASGDVVASLINLAFPSAKNQCLNALFSGAAWCFPGAGNHGLARSIADHGISVLYCASMHLESLCRELGGRDNGDLVRLRALVPAGSTVSEGSRRRVTQLIGDRLFVRYGTVETGPVCDAGPGDVLRVPGTVGRPLTGVVVEVIDAAGRALPPGRIGMVRIRSTGMVFEYAFESDATETKFVDGWFYPGDLGQMSEDGQLVYRGRADHMMIKDGINIYPEEIDATLNSMPGIKDAATLPVGHAVHQHIPVSAVVVEGSVHISPERLLEYARARLGARSPVAVVKVARIPRNEQGKLIRAELARMIEHELKQAPPQ